MTTTVSIVARCRPRSPGVPSNQVIRGSGTQLRIEAVEKRNRSCSQRSNLTCEVVETHSCRVIDGLSDCRCQALAMVDESAELVSVNLVWARVR
jgi:hypothetical protein